MTTTLINKVTPARLASPGVVAHKENPLMDTQHGTDHHPQTTAPTPSRNDPPTLREELARIDTPSPGDRTGPGHPRPFFAREDGAIEIRLSPTTWRALAHSAAGLYSHSTFGHGGDSRDWFHNHFDAVGIEDASATPARDAAIALGALACDARGWLGFYLSDGLELADEIADLGGLLAELARIGTSPFGDPSTPDPAAQLVAEHETR
ncbi:hypothetical protein SK069_09765 [Patulibacter brassicae]|uniref:Uncharacterized protein n=1 Tax=Patulibacter brassicae TaxID=1705717 RepID=A0ABU4VLA8_9ACTN|nr:hypothetical protein [Patulibacter brassicae]MDX8151879.1 hypothetical protein [Patulibacter brassicae]